MMHWMYYYIFLLFYAGFTSGSGSDDFVFFSVFASLPIVCLIGWYKSDRYIAYQYDRLSVYVKEKGTTPDALSELLDYIGIKAHNYFNIQIMVAVLTMIATGILLYITTFHWR
jgi:hypothetical protein